MTQIVLIDDDENLLNSLGDFVDAVAGIRSLRFHGLYDLRAHTRQVCSSESVLAIVDINLEAGQPDGIEVYRWLRANQFPGEIVFLTGHAKDHPAVQEASQVGNARIFEKPVEVEDLLTLVERHGHRSVQSR